jgi:hypothetical protein
MCLKPLQGGGPTPSRDVKMYKEKYFSFESEHKEDILLRNMICFKSYIRFGIQN